MSVRITDVRVLSGDSAFLIDDGRTAILYDSGFGFTAQRLVENIKTQLQGRNLDYIFLTHSHYDHVLGSVWVKKQYPEAKIVAAEYAAYIFSRPSALQTMRQLDRRVAEKHGVRDYDDASQSLTVDIPVKEGDTLKCGSMEFTVLSFAGHTKCSVGFYLPKERLLLGTETHGVYFGDNTYLPSYLVSVGQTMESYEKAKKLKIDRLLLPHYGVVEGEEAASCLVSAERVSRETAEYVKGLLREGKSREEVLEAFAEKVYHGRVKETYPVDAFRLNTSIMIKLIETEML